MIKGQRTTYKQRFAVQTTPATSCIDREIDRMVYPLYNLTSEEIAIVEAVK